MLELVVNIFFKNFRNYRNYRNWPIIVRIRFNTLFKNWSHFGRFPFAWVYPSEDIDGLGECGGKRSGDLPAAVFNSLLGILSRPVAFLSSIFSKMFNTISMLGVFRENDLSVVSR